MRFRLHFLAIMGAIMAVCAFGDGSLAASLTVYGPGGPYPAIRECADAFGRRQGMFVDVRFGEPEKQADQAARDGDVYYSGAEYMMDDFIRARPGLLDESTRISFASRRLGIIVQKGNPKGVKSLADLAAPGMRILDVRLENMAGVRGAANANTTVFVTTGQQGFATWKTRADLDAWVTYKTWAEQLDPGTGEFIPIEGPQGLRRVPAAMMRAAPHPETAKAFLEFLQSEEARSIFLKNGYEPY